MTQENTGLAVVTYNRQHRLKQCLESLEENNWGGAEHRVVCVDELDSPKYGSLMDEFPHVHWVFQENKGVAANKNSALKKLLSLGCDVLFLMEDDILMKSPTACIEYDIFARGAGVQHLNFALHGNQRRIKWRVLIKNIPCYPDCVGAFSYYTREVIETVGYMDENFVNAWEHVEHTMRIANAGYTTPFWFFADHPDNDKLLEEQEGSLEDSSIRPRSDWKPNIKKGQEYWIQKHGSFLPPRPDYNQILNNPTRLMSVQLIE